MFTGVFEKIKSHDIIKQKTKLASKYGYADGMRYFEGVHY